VVNVSKTLYEMCLKYNPNHGPDGRFTTGGGSGGGGPKLAPDTGGNASGGTGSQGGSGGSGGSPNSTAIGKQNLEAVVECYKLKDSGEIDAIDGYPVSAISKMTGEGIADGLRPPKYCKTKIKRGDNSVDATHTFEQEFKAEHNFKSLKFKLKDAGWKQAANYNRDKKNQQAVFEKTIDGMKNRVDVFFKAKGQAGGELRVSGFSPNNPPRDLTALDIMGMAHGGRQ